MPIADHVRLSPEEARWVIAQAGRAPSIHNTQPWHFRFDGDAFTLSADTKRGLSITDRHGRLMVISCGAALYNLQLALRQLGLTSTVTRLPDAHDPRQLARIRIAPGPQTTPADRAQFEAMLRRHTRRGDFLDRPVSPEVTIRLCQVAAAHDAVLLYVVQPGTRKTVLHLAREAERLAARDPRVGEEVEQWTPSGRRRDGVPSRAYPAQRTRDDSESLPLRDFDRGRGIGALDDSHGPTGPIAVLGTSRNAEVDWLTAGEAMQAVLVSAAEDWAFAQIDSTITEYPHLVDQLQVELRTAMRPQLLMAFGYAGSAPATPR